jgi:hypothetical protein
VFLSSAPRLKYAVPRPPTPQGVDEVLSLSDFRFCALPNPEKLKSIAGLVAAHRLHQNPGEHFLLRATTHRTLSPLEAGRHAE